MLSIGGNMKKFLMTLMLAIMSITVVVSNAEAKRMGGGGSFGKSSPSFSRQAPAQNNQAMQGSRAAPTPAAASPWKGIVGGALLGLGMGALLSHFGMGGALGSMIGTLLMVALFAMAAMFLFRMLSRKAQGQQPKPAFAGLSEKSMTPEIGSNISTGQAAPVFSGAQAPAIPADFDTEGFLRHAKTNFLRMQAAWDKADSQDIREFTTPEMFGELKMQLSERGASANHTDVVSLDAELLGIETNEMEHLASVRFHGMVREADHAPTEPFNEIWVLTKPVSGNGGWMLAGLQQV
jgi:predicted lipid-binding transport protein (Tim44 family)